MNYNLVKEAAMDKKVIAVYARKSKATSKGESLKVQIEKCKQHANYKFSDYTIEFIIYEEQEGKTGANLDREKFKELIKDITGGDKGIDILLVYKLDRLTRSVLDFSEIYEVLNIHNTEFISVKEDFDTTTPMGRAMLNITVVFAQLEREIIAERIQDSMTELAKTGRWLGGTTPLAYNSKVEKYENDAGQVKSKNHLEIVQEEVDILEKIYIHYLKLGSLSKLEAYFLSHRYKTRKDLDFRIYSLRFILSNPVYCCADASAYEYFIKNGYTIYSPKEAFDSSHGIMAYNKTLAIKNSEGKDLKESRWRKKGDWIIAVGEHKPLIGSEDWIAVQKMLEENKTKTYRSARSTDALLSGLIRCSCGNLMRPKTSKNRTFEDEKAFYYLCEMKERSKGSRCKENNVAGNVLDKLIVEKITNLSKEIVPKYNEALVRYQKIKQNNQIFRASKKDYIRAQIDKTKRYLNNTNIAILNATNEEAVSNFTEQYQFYLNELNSLELTLQIEGEEDPIEYDENKFIDLLSTFDDKLWNELSYEQRKYAVKELIQEINWNGREVEIFFKGSDIKEDIERVEEVISITANPLEEQMSFL